jgi:hypothetical protein
VWANNRRVDVSLNTTGQQSVRQYPFNAKDSLTLLSPSGSSRVPLLLTIIWRTVFFLLILRGNGFYAGKTR